MKKITTIFNTLRAIVNYHTRRVFLNNPPTFLWIEPTNKCNLNCIFCPNSRIPGEKTGFMDFGVFRKIIDESRDFAGSAFIFLGGEALLHQEIFRMIKYASDNGVRPLLHTNATLLYKERLPELFASGLDYISFSIDGFTRETYEKNRLNADFEKTLKNVLDFLEMKKNLRRKKPYTVIQTLLKDYREYKAGAAEERAFHRLFDDLPVDEINVRIPHAWGGKLFETDKYVPKSPGAVYSPCSFLWGSMSILQDGTVVPCCADFAGSYPLGNVKDRPLLEIWNSEPMLRLRKSMLDKTYLEQNPLCSNCMYIWEPRLFGLPVGLAMLLGQAVMNVVGSGAEKYFKRLAKIAQKSIWYEIRK